MNLTFLNVYAYIYETHKRMNLSDKKRNKLHISILLTVC